MLDGGQLGHPVAALPHEGLEVDVQVGGGEDAAQVHLRGDLQGKLGAAAAGVGGEVDPEAAHVEGGLQVLQAPLLKRGGPRLGWLGVIYSLYMQASTLSKNIF